MEWLMLSHSCPLGRTGAAGCQPGPGIQMFIYLASPHSSLGMCALSLSLKYLCHPLSLVSYLLSPVELCDDSNSNWVFQEWLPVCLFSFFAARAEMTRKHCISSSMGTADVVCSWNRSQSFQWARTSSICGSSTWDSSIQSSFELLYWPDRADIYRLFHKNQLNHVFF